MEDERSPLPVLHVDVHGYESHGGLRGQAVAVWPQGRWHGRFGGFGLQLPLHSHVSGKEKMKRSPQLACVMVSPVGEVPTGAGDVEQLLKNPQKAGFHPKDTKWGVSTSRGDKSNPMP